MSILNTTTPDFSLLPTELPILEIADIHHVGDMIGYEKTVTSRAGKGLPFTLSTAVAAILGASSATAHALKRIDDQSGVFIDAYALLHDETTLEKILKFARTAGLIDENHRPTTFYHEVISRSAEAPPLFYPGLIMAILIVSEARTSFHGNPYDGIWLALDHEGPGYGVILPTRLHVWESYQSFPFDPTSTDELPKKRQENGAPTSYGTVRHERSTSPLDIRRRRIASRYTALRLQMEINECEDPILRELLEDSLEKVERLEHITAVNIAFTYEPTGERVSVFAHDQRSLDLFAKIGADITQPLAEPIDAPPQTVGQI